MIHRLSPYDRLEREFNRKVAALQRACPHAKSTWMEHWWAHTHPSGYQVLVCDACHTTLREDPPKAVREAQEKAFLKKHAPSVRAVKAHLAREKNTQKDIGGVA